MQDKIVIIIGAGFSAPAALPIQDKILKEMTEPANLNFLEARVGKESIKFLTAYIQVSIYLLKEYTNVDVNEYMNEYCEIDIKHRSNDRVLEVIEYIREKNYVKAEEKNFNLMDALDGAAGACYLKDSAYYSRLLSLKERLWEQLRLSDIQISLEDVFTLFDKSITMKENTTDYTYAEIDKLQHAVLRLFTYYFSNKVNEHDYKNKSYLELLQYIKKYRDNVSFITTNWDILLEQYFKNNGVDYDYQFNSAYVVKPSGELYDEMLQVWADSGRRSSTTKTGDYYANNDEVHS